MKMMPVTVTACLFSLGLALFPAASMKAQELVSIAPDELVAQNDPVPIPPNMTTGEPPEVRRQAGVGGQIAYSRAGVVELGGALKATRATDFLELGLSPRAGWFFADNLQLSGILNYNYSKVEGKGTYVTSVIVEPSIHLPLTREQFVFFGLGLGALFQKSADDGAAIAPRVGFKHLVGRSGILTVDLQPVFSLNDSDVQTERGTVITVSSAYNLGVGYTVLL